MPQQYSIKIERLPSEKLTFKQRLAKKPTKIPAKVDLRARLPQAYDQGNLGSCTAQALVAAFQFLVPSFRGSRLFLYYNERVLESTIATDAGATLEDGVRALQKYGVCDEKSWPYITKKFAVCPPQLCYNAALKNRVVAAHNIRQTIADMKAELIAGFPFVVGISIFAGFESLKVAKTGIVPLPSPTDSSLGGHAVLVCGYDDGRQCWIVRNSWGSGWGDRGYFYLPYAYLIDQKLSTDLWSITLTSMPQKPYGMVVGPVRTCMH